MIEENIENQIDEQTSTEKLEEAEVVEEVATENKEKPKKKKSLARRIIEWVVTGVFGVIFVVFAIAQIDGMIHKKENYNQNICFGYGSFVILTDSMVPKYNVKDAIITKKIDSDVIYDKYLAYLEDETKTVDLTFFDVYNVHIVPKKETELNDQTYCTGRVMTHRLREVIVNDGVKKGEGKYTFIVAGINNQGELSKIGQYQAFTEQQLLGVVQYKSTFVGGLFSFITTPWGLLVFLLVPAFYLVITSVLDIFKVMKEPDEIEQQEGASDGGDGGPDKPKVDSLESLSEEDRERLKKEMLEEMLKGGGK